MQQHRWQREAAAAAEKRPSFVSTLKERVDALLHRRSSPILGELLRREEWQVDRCGSMRAYEVSVHRDDLDFYTLTLNPRSFADRLRKWWFKWADTNDE
ncbi:hypothetical protein cyc_04522 [Cyclospora cayetanensis]|nr:hypothetical protein cyc_04522 [Cyclospora cayetanensis]